MATSPIQRVVRIVLDKIAALKMEAEARKTFAGVERGISSVGNVAKRVGGFIAAAFGVRALIRFGFDAVRQAADAERAWKSLAGTVDNTGESFKNREADIRGLAQAFQDATIHSGGEFVEGLDRLITLTGDVDASLANMGLAANVAAQFFRGDLSQGIELVSKVMNGNISVLGKMGIHVKNAQEGLQVLAQRSFGAAERAGTTFTGRLAKINNLWNDFKEELGGVIVGSGESVTALTVVTSTLQTMVKWVADNKEEMRRFVAEGINVAIGALRTLIGLARDWFQLRGQLSFTAGTTPFQPADTKEGIERQQKVLAQQRKQAERDAALALAALEKFQKGFLGTGLIPGGQLNPTLLKLNTDLQAANDQLDKIDENARIAAEALANLGKAPPPKPPPLFGLPKVGKNAKPEGALDKDKIKSAFEETTKAADAMKAFADQMNQARTMSQLLGDDFDMTAAETAALTQVIEALALAGVDASDNFMVRFRDRLKELTFDEDKSAQVSADLVDALIDIQNQSELLGDTFDAESARAAAYQAAITALGSGVAANDPQLVAYATRLREITQAQELQKLSMENSIDVASDFASAIGAAMGAGLGPFAANKAKQNALEAAELGIRALVAGLTLDPRAGVFAAAAGQHAILAGAWGALAVAAGGGGSTGGVTGASGALGGARGASSAASQRAEAMTIVNIHFDGPDIWQPEVQQQIHASQEEWRQKKGNNVKFVVHKGKGR